LAQISLFSWDGTWCSAVLLWVEGMLIDMDGLSGIRAVVETMCSVKQKAKLKGEMNSNEIVMRA